MSTTQEVDDVRRIISDIDNLINEIMQVRRRIAALAGGTKDQDAPSSVKEAEWFGMWADRQDMQGLSSREWLDRLRAEEWTR